MALCVMNLPQDTAIDPPGEDSASNSCLSIMIYCGERRGMGGAPVKGRSIPVLE